MSLKKLSPTVNIKEGCFYTFQSRNETILVRVLEKNKVDNLHIVLHEGREKRMDLKRVKSLRRVTRKSDPSTMFLYLCDIGGGHYKLGITSCPQRRRREIKTYTRRATFLFLKRLKDGCSARDYEKVVLNLFSKQISKEGGREVMRLDSKMLIQCKRVMKHICSQDNTPSLFSDRKKNGVLTSSLEEKRHHP